MFLMNNKNMTGYPKVSDSQYLNYLAIWILEVCYVQIDPPQKEIDRVEEELRKICIFEDTGFNKYMHSQRTFRASKVLPYADLSANRAELSPKIMSHARSKQASL